MHAQTTLFFTLLLAAISAQVQHAESNDSESQKSGYRQSFEKATTETLRVPILHEAAWALQQTPVTVTSSFSPRSAGGRHDFFSEGDYWWPNPVSVDSPYIQRDGMSNPDNFTAHRLAMIRFSRIIGALASAYKITGDEKYVRQALIHCKAWFVDTATLMNPNLLFAQAIKGRATGRGIGIIDTIQLMEVVQGLLAMEDAEDMDRSTLEQIRLWFSRYLQWLTSHQYGKDEMNAANNHGTCWTLQVAAFARFTDDQNLLDFCRQRYKKTLLPTQMAVDGSFPRELTRTKPYGYSIFNLDAMTTICQLLSTPEDNLWTFSTPDGKSIQKGIEFLYPYLADKSKWPHTPDVMYWKDWPVAQPFLIFGANAFDRKEWFEIWKRLDHMPQTEEVIRNLPVRHPLIWIPSTQLTNKQRSSTRIINYPRVIAEAEKQTLILLQEIKAAKAALPANTELFSPRTLENGNLKLVPSKDWTSGFFPGELWMLYGYTHNNVWKAEAEAFTAAMEKEQFNGTTHDMGFKIGCSFGNGYRLTKDTIYKQVIIRAARTLSTRFNAKIGCIRSWDHHRNLWSFPVIIDNMMNLELLFEATRLSGDSSFYRIAVSHANTTMKNHFRSYYSSYHVVDYDTLTGKPIKKMTWQGYSDESAWSRGQAWGLYSYTMCYRETGDKSYLQQAEGIAGFILHHPHLPADKIPYWDFNAPGIPQSGSTPSDGSSALDTVPRDASAAAIIASGLYELSRYSRNATEYRTAADKILESLTDKYRSPLGDNRGFILSHSTGSRPSNSEVDVPINYGDYYYLEAVLRSKETMRNK